ncbi:MAG: DUF4268 domain-containing protein [Bacteroidales bacterium]|nr:DUF4268 domain-containing protein [Bacteroidales bacterium]
MFIIDKIKNRIEKISEKSFADLGFHERANLQEWLANNPEALGEELLIIQKEFNGFNDTRERLDLLGLDKQGNLVVIENKLDDSGRDVTWQVLKYASYCSSLKKLQIINIYQDYLSKIDPEKKAEEALSEFFDNTEIDEIQLNKGLTQRIMMVAANFRKEVTSTVLWLLNYNVRIQCFKVTPFALGDQLLLNLEQIIPLRDAEEFSISIAEKTQEDVAVQEELKSRHKIRLEYWEKLLKEVNQKTNLYANISPSKQAWIGAGVGIRGVTLNFAISKNYARCEIYIDRGEFDENKMVFDFLHDKKDRLEKDFDGKLEWERLDDKRASRIKYENTEYNVFEKEHWDAMISFMVDGMIRMEKAFKNPLKEIQRKLKTM